MDVTVDLKGFAELAQELKNLPEKIGKNVLRSAVGAGAAVIRVEAKKNAQAIKDTGTLARSIYQKQIRELSGPEKQTFYVGARQGKAHQKVGKKGLSRDAFYARFVELGHFSRPSTGVRIGRSALIDHLKAGTVHWVPARPFLRPAFEVGKTRAVDAMGAKIAERLQTIKAKP